MEQIYSSEFLQKGVWTIITVVSLSEYVGTSFLLDKVFLRVYDASLKYPWLSASSYHSLSAMVLERFLHLVVMLLVSWIHMTQEGGFHRAISYDNCSLLRSSFVC